jgi:hypothetical protein
MARSFTLLIASGVLLAFAGSALAQAGVTVGPQFGYTATSSTASYHNIAGKPNTIYIPLGGVTSPEDDGYSNILLPFDFSFFGTPYAAGSQLYLNANGYILFGTASITPTPSNLLTEGASFGNQPAIAPLFMDLVARGMQEGGPGVYAQTTGEVGSRKLTIEWSSVQDFNNGNPSDHITFQAVLYEGTGQMDFNYQSTLFGTSADNGAGATIGIRDTTFADPPDNLLQWGFKPGTPEGTGFGLEDGDMRISFNFNGSAVPEPTSIALCGLGGAGIATALYRQYRRKRKAANRASK